MNIKRLFLAAATLTVFAACSEYDPGMSNNVLDYTDEELATIKEYAENFVTRYGAIDPNHTWGFGELGSEDEALSTRGSSPEGNLWESWGYEIPAPITDRERAAVVEAFRTHTQSDTNPQLTNFFVQQVYKGGWEYALVDHNEADYTYPDNTEGNHNYYISSDHMDHLHCGVARTGDQLYNEWDNGYDHIFDFNYGNSDDYNGCMLMLNSATTDFYYNNSVDSKQHHEYIILTVTWTEEDGSQHSGAYVGFDFYATGENPNQQCERDWKFDDWIVKIIPGDGQRLYDHQWYRVMCEDLGNTYDYDFNDLVYDVYFTGNSTDGYVANIKVQAAGGVYPIFIGIHDVDHEAHRLLGRSDTYNTANNQYKPLNVGGQTGVHDGILRVPVNTTNADLIPIYVEPTGKALERNVFILPTDDEVSEAPQKICIPGNTTKWTKENQNIEWAYPNFKYWVNAQDGTYGFPYNTVDGKKKYFEADGTGWNLVTDPAKTPWNTTGIVSSYLYQ